MREVTGRLFEPPGSPVAVVLPVSADGHLKYGHERRATKRWPGVDDLIRQLYSRTGARTIPLTYDKEGKIAFHGGRYLNTRWHLIAMPVRRYSEAPIDLDITLNAVRQLTRLLREAPPLAEGDVVLPAIADDAQRAGSAPTTWAKLRPLLESYLADDRFVVIADG